MGTHKLFFAGSGGQGILLMGQMITRAAMLEDKTATFFPSYGPEMRGGTANCTVVVSDREVSCPIIYEADCLVAMNLPSLVKFESIVKPGGVILINSSMIDRSVTRPDVTAHEVPVNELAAELGNPRVANMVMLGAAVRLSGAVSGESMLEVLRATLGVKKAEMLEINIKAYNSWKQ